MKKFVTFLLIISAMISMSVCGAMAIGNDIFLCMHAGSSMAYQSSNFGSLDYIEMKDSGGAIAKAKNIEGSTYLPFRYIAELAGLTEASGNHMDAYTFKYDNRSGGSITIQAKSGRITRDVNIPFTYKTEDGEEIEYKIVNIDGSLYFPMRYMAALVDGNVAYQASTGNVYFMSNERVKKEYLTGSENDLSIKYQKLASMNYYEYDNTLGYSDIYLKSDGETVSSVTEELRNNQTYYSVTRARKNLYYVDENYRMWTKKEGEEASSPIVFYNTKNEKTEPLVLTIITYQNKLYGIEIKNENTKTGKIFKADLDGENYKYISDSDRAYNIILREYKDTGYIFYVDAENKTDIHRINLSTGEDKVISVAGPSGNSLINPIDIMSVNEDTIVVSELDNKKINIIHLSDSIYEKDTVRGSVSDTISEINRSTAIEKVSSLNYDTDNQLLYFINNTGKSYGIYCYDIPDSHLYSINTSQTAKRRISIIKISESMYRIYHYADTNKNEYKYELVSIDSDGNIKIGNNIVIDR